VQANRSALQQALRLPSPPRWLRQVHGISVAQLGPLPGPDEPQADAAVSHIPGTVLSILTADCLPVLFCADDGSEIGAAHAGWRGLAAGVLEATLTQLETPPARLLAWLGPCIGAASYEVGEEVRSAFVATDTGAADCFVPTRAGHWLCDLAALARRRLQACGVRRIHGGGFDTLADTRFYSYRREGARSGRFASLIWLADS
jgi:YfiH family protein